MMFAALLGFLAGLLVCSLIWFQGERAEQLQRIERARRRDHSKVPVMSWGVR